VPNSFTPATTILSSAVNANFTDIATALSSVLTRDNQAPMTAPLRLADGSQPLPGLQFANDTNTGLRRSGADEMRWVAGGNDAMYVDADGKMWQLGALDVAGAVNLQAALAALTAVLAAAATPLTLRRTENDTTEREAETIQSGSGAGAKYSRRIVGTGANAINLVREYLGSTQITEVGDTFSKLFVQLVIGLNSRIVLHPDGYTDLAEIATPANPAANVARVYVRDTDGVTELAWRDSAGFVSVLRNADQGDMQETGDRSVTANVQHFHPGHPKAWGAVDGGAGTLLAGYGVASVSRTATGNFLITLEEAMSGDYAVIATAQQGDFTIRAAQYEFINSTQFRIRTVAGNSTAVNLSFSFEVKGTLA
jgi:hypothetical protein